MEQSLIEKWKNDTMDEIDKEMFRARLRVAADKTMEGLKAISDAVETYPDEMKIMGICLAVYADSLYKKSPIGSCRMLVGEPEKLTSYVADMQEVIDKMLEG